MSEEEPYVISPERLAEIHELIEFENLRSGKTTSSSLAGAVEDLLVERNEAPRTDIADAFTAEELWLLYPHAADMRDELARAERLTMTDCGSAAWRSLAAKIRLQIERLRPGGSG